MDQSVALFDLRGVAEQERDRALRAAADVAERGDLRELAAALSRARSFAPICAEDSIALIRRGLLALDYRGSRRSHPAASRY